MTTHFFKILSFRGTLNLVIDPKLLLHPLLSQGHYFPLSISWDGVFFTQLHKNVAILIRFTKFIHKSKIFCRLDLSLCSDIY